MYRINKFIVLLLVITMFFSSCRTNVQTSSDMNSDYMNNSSDLVVIEDEISNSESDQTESKESNSEIVKPQTESINPNSESTVQKPEKKVITFSPISFVMNGGKNTVTISFPKEWNLKKNQNQYLISRDGNDIGYISLKAPDVFNAAECDGELYNATMKGETKEYTINNTLRRGIFVQNISKKINIYIDFISDEIRYSSAYHLGNSITISDYYENIIDIENKNGANKILILGNSFLGTSKIGNFLEAMFIQGNKNYQVDVISVGGASIENFANEYYSQKIISGDYFAIFQCGIYNDRSKNYIDYIKSACDKTNTNFVLFPAHNEVEHEINEIKFLYPEILVLNWKNTIEKLVYSGVFWEDFCINDSHKHSKPLAGYVGALMIYRALFNEPPLKCYNYPLDMNYIEKTLGDYTYTGHIKLEADNYVKFYF